MNSDARSTGCEGVSSDDRYHGFSLQSVCWGYRDIFERTIESLFDQGLIGSGNQQVSRRFFELLKSADQSCFDHVLREFIGAINPRTRWVMDLPGIFEDVTTLGRELAETRLHYGISFFRALGEGGLGSTPKQVRALVDHMRSLWPVDQELAFAFMKGYGALVQRLSADEIPLYMDQGIRIFHQNRAHGLRFMECVSRSAENVIRGITRECRLDDVQGSLAGMLTALAGYEVEVADLGTLDSDELIERGSSLVCMHKWAFFPRVLRSFPDARNNRQWYVLLTVICAGMLADNSFCRIHGLPAYRTCKDLVGDAMLGLNLFQLIEYTRIVQSIRQTWPGARRLLDFGLHTEFAGVTPRSPVDRVLRECLEGGRVDGPVAAAIHAAARSSVNAFDTASMLSGDLARDMVRMCPAMAEEPLRTVSFLPDFLYPGEVSSPPDNLLVADLKEKARRRRRTPGEDEAEAGIPSPTDRAGLVDPAGEPGQSVVEQAFLYDEWCQAENDYYKDYCKLREMPAAATGAAISFGGHAGEIRQVRRMFERLKPDIVKREKRLSHGDYINTDILVDYLVQKRVEPHPRIEFYEKPLIKKRDLAVLILLDVSGSTGNALDKGKVLDIEKRAAVILGEGLQALGDAFSVCGFSGQGRDRCEYFVYKDFRAPWDRNAMQRILSAHPRSSTRIGVALRHSGFRMSSLEHRQRLIILVTDGQPMDSDYDPGTRYAQYDVRKACEENARMDINTFGVSTLENTRANMEIMFPRNRFVILPDLTHLPRVLPRLYIRMTV